MARAIRAEDATSSRSGKGGKGARHGNGRVDPLDVSQRLDLKVNYRLVLVGVAYLEEIRTLDGIDTHVLVPLTLKGGQVTFDAVLLDQNVGDLLKRNVGCVASQEPHLGRSP